MHILWTTLIAIAAFAVTYFLGPLVVNQLTNVQINLGENFPTINLFYLLAGLIVAFYAFRFALPRIKKMVIKQKQIKDTHTPAR